MAGLIYLVISSISYQPPTINFYFFFFFEKLRAIKFFQKIETVIVVTVLDFSAAIDVHHPADHDARGC
jgi:hypothetical protein